MIVLDAFTLGRRVFEKLNTGLYRVTDPDAPAGTIGARYFVTDGHVSSQFWEVVKASAAEVSPSAPPVAAKVPPAKKRPSA
jgi:hypothetical protein